MAMRGTVSPKKKKKLINKNCCDMLRMLYLRRQEREQNSVDLSLGSYLFKYKRTFHFFPS